MKKKVEGEKGPATLELLKLAKENPGLPVIAEVNSEVVADDGYTSWFGEVTEAHIESVWTGRTYSEMFRIFFNETWTLNEALMENDTFIEENAPESLKRKLEKLNDTDFDKAANEWIKSLPWKKCIVVYVDVPDNLLPEPEI